MTAPPHREADVMIAKHATTPKAATLVLVLAFTAIPHATAGHNQCDDEQTDINLAGFAGADPTYNGGVAACAQDLTLAVEQPDTQGSGAVFRVCIGDGATPAPCDQVEILGTTGVTFSINTAPPLYPEVCRYFDGSKKCYGP